MAAKTDTQEVTESKIGSNGHAANSQETGKGAVSEVATKQKEPDVAYPAAGRKDGGSLYSR
jgi:hypothetical protein